MKSLSSRRQRSRSRGGQRRVSIPLLLAGAAIVGALFLGPVLASSQAFSTLAGDRGTDVAVVNDPQGYLGVDATDRVRAGERTELATLTNHLNERATVTLELVDGTDGTVSAPGDTTFDDDRIRVDLDPASSVSVDINATHPGEIEYETAGETSVTTVTLVRTVTAEPPTGGGDECDEDDDDDGDQDRGDSDDDEEAGDDDGHDDDDEQDDECEADEDDDRDDDDDDRDGTGSDQKAISFAAFCTADGSGTASDVQIVDVTYDDEGEPVAIEWTADVPLSTVVLKAGPGMENFPGGTSGSAESGAGTAAGDDQSPPQPCPDNESLVYKDESVGE